MSPTIPIRIVVIIAGRVSRLTKGESCMHIAEGVLPPLHAAAWTVAAAPFVIHGAYEVVKQVREHPERRLLLGAAGAFSFVMSAIKIPSVTGSSSHPTGTGLGAVLFKPPVMALLGTLTLIFQTLLLSHGGLTTLGANAFSMAIIGPWVAYAVFVSARAMLRNDLVAVFFAAALANLTTYVVTATQLALAHPGEVGFFESWVKFLSLFAITQIPLSIIEGIVTVLVIRALQSADPGLLRRLGVTGPEPVSAVAQSTPAAEPVPVAATAAPVTDSAPTGSAAPATSPSPGTSGSADTTTPAAPSED